jgi:methionine-S-sulfoxide reductase
MRKELATFSGGCFWCMVEPFEKIPGVESVHVGFTGGTMPNPTYEQVSMGQTDHCEAIQISFRPDMCAYQILLDTFWRQIDPTDDGGQFSDRGYTYLTAIYYHNEKQREQAEQSKKALENSGLFSKAIVTEILLATPFYLAEEYHQRYHEKNPLFYVKYRQESGRDQFINEVWGKKADKK